MVHVFAPLDSEYPLRPAVLEKDFEVPTATSTESCYHSQSC